MTDTCSSAKRLLLLQHLALCRTLLLRPRRCSYQHHLFPSHWERRARQRRHLKRGMLLCFFLQSIFAACPPGLALQAHLQYEGVGLLACEDIVDGDIVFTLAQPSLVDSRASTMYPLSLHKRTASNRGSRSGDSYLGNLTKHEVLNASTDIMGNTLLGIHGHPAREHEPTLAEVTSAIPPLKNLGSWGGNGARLWTASRGSLVDCVLDENGEAHLSGLPLPKLVAARLPGLESSAFTTEGLLVGDGAASPLPILVLGFPTAPGTHSWEMSVVPVPNNSGFTQPVHVCCRGSLTLAALAEPSAPCVRANRYASCKSTTRPPPATAQPPQCTLIRLPTCLPCAPTTRSPDARQRRLSSMRSSRIISSGSAHGMRSKRAAQTLDLPAS